MQPRRPITLRELIERLRPFESKGISPERTVFTDLRLGTLRSFSLYPKYLPQHLSEVPTSYWANLSFEEFLGEPNRGGQPDDIFVPSSIFAEAERKRLANAARAIRSERFSFTEEPLRTHFEVQGWLGDKVAVDQIEAFCRNTEEQLDRDLSEDINTTAYVRAEQVPTYMAEIAGRLGSGHASEGFRWKEIYEEIMQKLLREPTVLDFGKVDRTLEEVRNWALTKYANDEVPSKKALRAELDANVIHIVRPPKKRTK